MLGPNGEELKAHSFFLMTTSPIFHQIFTSDGVSDGSRPDLRIAGISKQTMTEICRYAYTESVNLTRGNMLLILFAATKFQMKFLVEKTVNFIGSKDGMAEATVFKILEANKVYNDMSINMNCFEFIEKNHQKCFKQKDFLALPIDTLHMIVKMCKLPQTVKKGAVALWSAQEANSEEDLDDVLAQIELNDYQEETSNGGGSDHQTTDSESVNSKNSRARSARGGQNQRNRAGPNQQGNQPNFNHRQYGNPQDFNNQQQYPNQQQQQFPNQQRHPNQQQRGRGGVNGFQSQRGRGSHAQGTHNSQNNFNQHEQQLAGLNGLIFLGTQQGLLTRKNFKFANLDLSTLSTPIAISEIRFVYDLSATDKEFELWIDDMTVEEKALLFYEKVSTHGKTEGGYTRYVLPRPCEISAGRKIRLRIEFKKQEHRLSFEDFVISSSSAKERLGIRREPNVNSYAYIISAIAFYDC